jgi:hypothetical protein
MQISCSIIVGETCYIRVGALLSKPSHFVCLLIIDCVVFLLMVDLSLNFVRVVVFRYMVTILPGCSITHLGPGQGELLRFPHDDFSCAKRPFITVGTKSRRGIRSRILVTWL